MNRHSHRTLFRGSLTILAGLTLAATCFAQADEADNAAQAGDKPAAAALLEKFSEHYRGLEAVTGRARHTMKVVEQGRDQFAAIDFALQRPNRVAMHVTEGSGGGDTVCDGSRFYMLMRRKNKYMITDAPKDFLVMRNAFARRAPVTPGAEVLLDMLSDDPASALMGDASRADYVGIEDLDGQKAHHVHTGTEQMDSDIWISTGDTPWMLRYRRDMKMRQPQAAKGKDQPAKTLRVLMEFSDWSADKPDPARFDIRPPESAERVDPSEGTGPSNGAKRPPAKKPAAGQPARPASKDEPHETVGKSAPAFTADLLGGGKLDLKDHLGKHVIVLDFWATWCGPCLLGLPVVSKVAGDMQDKGVVFYAVDLREKAEKVQELVDKREFKFNVVLDTKGDIAKSYGVGPIPHTVIIGRDGQIADVHIGFAPGIEQELKEKLEEAVAK